MRSEAELRDWMHADPGSVSTLDAATIIRRAKRRRLPAQVGVGTLATLSVAGVGVFAITSLPAPTSTMSVSDSGATAPESGEAANTYGSNRAPVEKLNPCGGALADVAPSALGLVLTTRFPETAPTGSEPVAGVVTLTNTGSERVTGTTAASPAITLSRDGITLWHSNGPMIMLAVLVDLAPGESMDYTASFLPVACSTEDELDEGFREGLPPLEAGQYQVSAAIELVRDTAVAVDGGADQQSPPSGGAELVTGPLQTITLQ